LSPGHQLFEVAASERELKFGRMAVLRFCRNDFGSHGQPSPFSEGRRNIHLRYFTIDEAAALFEVKADYP